MTYCNCDLEMSGKHRDSCSKIQRPKLIENYTIETWRAEAVKNWTQALANLNEASEQMEPRAAGRIGHEIIKRIMELLGIADG